MASSWCCKKVMAKSKTGKKKIKRKSTNTRKQKRKTTTTKRKTTTTKRKTTTTKRKTVKGKRKQTKRKQQTKKHNQTKTNISVAKQLEMILHKSETTKNLTRALINVLLVLYGVRRVYKADPDHLNAIHLFISLLNDWQLVPNTKLISDSSNFVYRSKDRESKKAHLLNELQLRILLDRQCATDAKWRDISTLRRSFDISVTRGTFEDQLFVEMCSDDFLSDWLERGVNHHMKLVDEYARILGIFGYRVFLKVTEIKNGQRRLLFDSRKV